VDSKNDLVESNEEGGEENAESLVRKRLEGERLFIEEEFDRGGMGRIERALDRHLSRTVARKVLDGRLRHEIKSVRYFLREACITARLAHPAIVPVHELGVDADGRLFFTMKLVEGKTLGTLVRESEEAGPPTGERLFELLTAIERVCEALALAHSQGIYHRDLKPENVMIGRFGAVYLMDWGVAACDDDEAELPDELHVNEGRSAVGTPAYMAPEQALGEKADARTDVFGVGGLLYYILTRRAPHRGETVMAVLQKAAYEQVVVPSTLVGEGQLPVALERLVMRALAYDAKERFASIGDFAAELRRFMRGGGDFPQLKVAKGDHVVQEGETGDAAYIVVSGRLRVYRKIKGKVHALRIMGRGEVFGEMAILGSGRRSASVIAMEECDLLVVTRETLEREVGDMKPWVGALVRSLAQRFEQREREFLKVSSASGAPARTIDVRRVLQQVLLLLRGWAGSEKDGALEASFSTVVAQVEALMDVPRARVASVLEGHRAFEIDTSRDLLRVREAEDLLEQLHLALGV
jgi:serine/threonine-protein kinase